MLEIKDLHVFYGAIHALKGISLTVADGELVSLIGANGAGKTTTLHAISGLLPAASGSILLDGTDLQKVPANTIIGLGMAHVPEGRHVFARMTVEENLRMGAYILRDQKRISENLERVYGHFPRLKERRRQLAGTLSGGEQQMLSTGRALMTDPKIVLMDEPSMGLSPLLVKEIFSIIQELHKSGITILLVEQNAKMALAVSDRAYVLETGTISMEGPAAELAADDRVRKAYLARKEAEHMERFIITVARETGSGGHNVTRRLSEALGIPYYDRDLLRKASEVSGIHERLFGAADERIGLREMLSAAEKVYTGEILPPDSDDYISTRNLFSFQAKIIKELADSESCVILGRCANYLLMDRPNVLRVFIHAPLEARLARVASYSLAWSQREVARHIRVEDHRRAAYYHYYTGEEWRDAAGYDLSLDSEKLGEDGCVEFIRNALPLFIK